jgi:DNA-binding transcriptional regulator YdaS (Cro superfamily)
MQTPLKNWREQEGKTAAEAAYCLGVTPAMWSRWETGSRRIPAERVLLIESRLGIPRHQLRPDLFGEAVQ